MTKLFSSILLLFHQTKKFDSIAAANIALESKKGPQTQ